ncbi:hypothetical protein PPERSA_05579 [Pseudocohnilembus persalinus]|uniref:Uncharacterized protein n=1 Tax=Pseudocohnilembus persalinus TaxID=266149 RepID=A0A0V0Q7U6_PSEPJ|nr:hypothetical protein PPERSA_05579 [Pseudocohnilembus persalinus]|eukprot:KRW98235.1 hypothetical protein PPERSA_05579 [Pseudocohnilembus persalinus]
MSKSFCNQNQNEPEIQNKQQEFYPQNNISLQQFTCNNCDTFVQLVENPKHVNIGKYFTCIICQQQKYTEDMILICECTDTYLTFDICLNCHSQKKEIIEQIQSQVVCEVNSDFQEWSKKICKINLDVMENQCKICRTPKIKLLKLQSQRDTTMTRKQSQELFQQE